MPTLIPTAYMITFGGLPGTRVDIWRADEGGWIAKTAIDQHLVFYTSRVPGESGWYYWEDDDHNDPAVFPTAQDAADAAITGRWWLDR